MSAPRNLVLLNYSAL